jgi:hypothetical protein
MSRYSVQTLLLTLGALILIALPKPVLPVQSVKSPNAPRYNAKGELQFPEEYREWMWLSSGFGMAYGPGAANAASPFDNVFVRPEAYRSFMQTGKWPDQTVFVIEFRSSQTEGSINKQGRFQGDVVDIEVEVKDESRFPTRWAFFAFGKSGNGKSVGALPQSAACYSCHAQNGAVDNTFVQFYPTLIDVAKRKGTFVQR